MTTDDVIQSLQNSIQFAHLKKDLVELPGRDDPTVPVRKILIIEQCGLTDSRRGRFDFEVKTNPIHNEFIDVMDEFGAARLYVDLASVSFGDVPTLLEFIAMIPSTASIWVEKAVSINPPMFEWLTEMAKAAKEIDKKYFESLNIETRASAENTEGSAIKKKRKRRKSETG